jgi:2-dehydropantoate 2-reductase
MCQAISEAFAALRAAGTGGMPRNLAVLHKPLLKTIALRYWARTMRSPMGELCFAAHSRHAEAEMRALARDVQDRIPGSPAIAELLGSHEPRCR